MSYLSSPVPRITRPLLFLAAALAATCAIGLAAHGSSARAAAPPPCEAKLTKIGGKRAVVNCGPATAALTVDGHTYHYNHGYCSDSKSAGAKLDLDLGTLIAGAKGNGGEPYFSMLVAASAIGGSVFEADSGGKQVLGDTLITASGEMKGTFTGKDTSEEVSGSWNCHGVIWHAP